MNLRLTLTAAIATIAASIALHPLIASSTWFWEGAGAVIVVAGVASLTRLRTLPVVVCLLATGLGLLLYLNLVFSGRRSLGGVLPTQASLAALLKLNGTGWAEAARFAPPVPGLHGITFLAVAGIGLAALFTDLLAVRLRKAAAAGLPLLALFSATVASKASAPTIDEAAIFCIGVAGYLALLAADGRERIQLWGRLVSMRPGGWPQPAPGQRPQLTGQDPAQGAGQAAGRGAGRGPAHGRDVPLPDTHALAAAGRRVGMAAMAAAILVPLLIPGLQVRDLFGGGPVEGGHPGESLITLPNPVVQLDQQLHRGDARIILNYHSDNATPPYLRVYALELSPIATIWDLSLQQVNGLGSDGQVPSAPGLQAAQSRLTHTRVTVEHGVNGTVFSGSHTENFLPLPYPPADVQGIGDGWAVDPGTLMVWSANSISGLRYTATSRDVEPTEQELRTAPQPAAGILAQEVAVPNSYDSLAGLARQITRGAVNSYERAVELQQWFTAPGNFSYSLGASEPDTPAGLKDFLLHSKRGFCQQFAFAFAVLARLLGIPARVAVGYTAGTSLGHGNWRVTTSDAHAWPELYFQGAGWLPWEPTPPGTGAGQGTAKAPSYTITVGGPSGPGGSQGQTSPGSTGTQPGQSRSAGVSQHQRFAPDQGPSGFRRTLHSHGQWLWWLLIPVALVLIFLLLPLGIRQLARLQRMLIITRRTAAAKEGADATRSRVHAAWLEIRDDLEDFGVSCPANESPRALVHRLTAQLRLPQASLDSLGRLALAEERASYAASLADLPPLRADITSVSKAVAASVNLPTRWRARIFPASALSPLRQSSGQVMDVFGWIEVATSWLSAHLRPGARKRVDGTTTR